MAEKSATDILKRMLLFFRRNWGLKLVSLLFAIILWNYVIVEVNPMVTKTYTNVPVTVNSNSLQMLKNSGLTVSEDITKLRPVSVQIKMTRRQSLNFSKASIVVMADFSAITHEGKAADVRLAALIPADSTITAVPYPPTIPVDIGLRDTRTVPVKFVPNGQLPPNYWMGSAQVTPDKLDVSGPAANVKKVDRAEVHVDLTGQTASISSALDVILLDASGNVIDKNSNGLECQSSCIVNLEILPTKTVTLDASNSLNGSPAWGYELGGVDVEPKQITVAGSRETLDAMGDTLPLGKIDISGAKADVSMTQVPTLPEGVRFVGTGTVQALVNINTTMTKVTVKDVRVTLEGLDSTLKADKSFTTDVTLTCPLLYASRIRRSNLTVTADATGYGAGSHTLPLQASYTDPNAAVADNGYTLSPDSITVTFTAKSTS